MGYFQSSLPVRDLHNYKRLPYESHITVFLKDGTQTVFYLKDKPVITFTNDALVIKTETTEETVEVPVNEINMETSMVIELNNGTQITLGPNDLKNIAFSDDNVVLTGNIIDELHNKMTELEASIAALQMMADQLRKQLEEKSSNDKVSALEAYMADMRPGWKA